MNKYEILNICGEGAYGVVLKCRNKENGEIGIYYCYCYYCYCYYCYCYYCYCYCYYYCKRLSFFKIYYIVI